MRGLLFLFIQLTLLASNAQASGACGDIRKELIVLEASIQSSKLPRCSAGKAARCCDPSRPLTCKTILELNTRHNQLMGKLVILEGIIAIGKAMEADHSSVMAMDPKDLVKARNSVDKFLTGYRKAALLDSSLDADFWTTADGSEYKGADLLDFADHIKAQCSRDDDKLKGFCSKLDAAKNEPGVSYRQILIALAGFAQADSYGRISPADKESDYEKYRKALELTIGSEKVSYESDSEQIKEIIQLRASLEKAHNGIDEESAQKAINIARELDGISVNYGELIRPNEKFASFYDKNIKNSIAGFNQASRALLQKDKMLENMDKMERVFKNHIDSSMVSIEQNIKEKTSCSGRGETLLLCFKKVCSPDASGDCAQKGDARNAQNLHSLSHQIQALERLKRMSSDIGEAKTCIEKPVKDQDSALCARNLQAKMGLANKDQVDQLRREIHDLEAAMENMNLADDINDLKLSKAMGLMAFKSKGCLPEENKETIDDFASTCASKPVQNFSQEIVKLGDDAGRIIEFSQNPFINKELSMPSRKYGAYKTEFLRRCEENRGDAIFCDMYKTDKVVAGIAAGNIAKSARELKASKTANRRLPAKTSFSKVESSDPGSAFLAGLGTSVVTKGIPYFMQYNQMKTSHDSMMNYHRNRLSYLNSQYDYYKSNSQIPFYYHPYTNYGYPLYQYSNAGQFGANSGNTLYRQPYDFTQFSFTPNIVMEPFGASDFSSTGAGSTGASSTGSGFNFGS